MNVLILSEIERAALIDQTAWLCGGMVAAMAALIFFAWWFWYPEAGGEI